MANLLSTSISGTATTSDSVVIGGTFANNPYNSVSSTRLMFGGGTEPNNYSIGTSLQDYGGNYTKLDIRWHTGIRMGAQPGYGGIRFFSNETLATRIMSIGEGDAHVRVDNNLYVGNTIYNNGNAVIHAGNIGSQSVSYASSAGSVAWNNVTSKPSLDYQQEYTFTAPASTDGSGYSWVRIPMGGFNAGSDFVRFSIARAIFWNDSSPYGGPSMDVVAYSREWHGGQEGAVITYAQHGSEPGSGWITNAGPRDLHSGGYWFYMRIWGGVDYAMRVYRGSGQIGTSWESTSDPGSVFALRVGVNNVGSTHTGFNTTGPIYGSTLYNGTNAVIHAGNIASQSVSYAVTSGTSSATTQTDFSELSVGGEGVATREYVTSQGYLTSLPSHNHDDRYYTEAESDGRFFFAQSSQLANTNLNDLTTRGVYYSADNYGTNTNIPFANYFTMINLTNDAGRRAQLWFGDTPGSAYWRPRQGDSTTWHAWENLITSNNIGSQSVSYATSAGNSNTTSQIVFNDLKTNFPSGAGGGHSFASNHYSMGLDSGNGGWDGPHYRDVIIGYHTGVRIGAHYSGIRFYNNSPTTDANNDGNGDSGEALLMTIGGYVGTADHTDVVVNNNLFANVSMRAPIFYDSNDTSYYVDPNSTSRLNILSLVDYQYIGGQVVNGQSHYQWEGATYRNPGGYNAGLIIRRDNSTTGLNGSYPALVLYNNNGGDQTTVAMSFATMESASGGNAVPLGGIIAKKSIAGNNGGWSSGSLTFYVKDLGTRRDALYLDTSGYVQSDYSLRAPIFYDSNDTTYYGDFAGISSMYGVAIRGDLSSTDTSNQIFFWGDGNSTTSAIGFKANGGNFTNPTGFGDGYNTYLTMDTPGRGWVFREGTGGTNFGAAYTSGWILNNGVWQANASMRAPIFYDSDDTGYYLDPNGTSNLLQLTTSTRARWNMPRVWYDRSSRSSDQGYWTGTNGWGTEDGTWATAWKGGFSGWDIWGTGTDHPQGGGYVHAQGIVSGQHAAASDGSTGYGWMMVGAADATANRYWLRGKWGTTTSGWVEMITTGNIASQSVASATSASYADSIYWSGNQRLYGGSDGTRNTGWAYHNNNNSGLHWPNNGWHIYPVNASDMFIRSGASDCSLKFTKNGESGSYVHCSAANEIGFLTTDRSWSLRVDNSGNAFATTSFRAPIFYDSNDTSYYGDFASTSRMNAIVYDNLYFSGDQTYGFIGRNVYADTINGRGSDPLELNYYDGGSVIIGTGANGSKALYAGSLFSGGSAVITAANIGSQSVSYATSAGSASSSSQSNSLVITGYGNGNMTYYQSSGTFAGYSGWAGYFVSNHGDGATYYNQTIIMPFWGPPQYSRLQGGGAIVGPYTFWSTENLNDYAPNMNQYVRTTDNVTFNTTTSPTILVNGHSDNTKGYRIHNTSGSSVSAMFTNSSNALVIGAGAFDQVNLNKKVYVNGVALGVNVSPSGTAGRIDASNDIVAFSSSDERLKHNITPIENALDKVKSLTGVEFDWKPEYKHAHGYEGHDTGIIAQQVQDVMPSAVRTNATGFLAVRYEKLIGLLIEANKELAARVEELEKKLS